MGQFWDCDSFGAKPLCESSTPKCGILEGNIAFPHIAFHCLAAVCEPRGNGSDITLPAHCREFNAG